MYETCVLLNNTRLHVFFCFAVEWDGHVGHLAGKWFIEGLFLIFQ